MEALRHLIQTGQMRQPEAHEVARSRDEILNCLSGKSYVNPICFAFHEERGPIDVGSIVEMLGVTAIQSAIIFLALVKGSKSRDQRQLALHLLTHKLGEIATSIVGKEFNSVSSKALSQSRLGKVGINTDPVVPESTMVDLIMWSSSSGLQEQREIHLFLSANAIMSIRQDGGAGSTASAAPVGGGVSPGSGNSNSSGQATHAQIVQQSQSNYSIMAGVLSEIGGQCTVSQEVFVNLLKHIVTSQRMHFNEEWVARLLVEAVSVWTKSESARGVWPKSPQAMKLLKSFLAAADENIKKSFDFQSVMQPPIPERPMPHLPWNIDTVLSALKQSIKTLVPRGQELKWTRVAELLDASRLRLVTSQDCENLCAMYYKLSDLNFPCAVLANGPVWQNTTAQFALIAWMNSMSASNSVHVDLGVFVRNCCDRIVGANDGVYLTLWHSITYYSTLFKIGNKSPHLFGKVLQLILSKSKLYPEYIAVCLAQMNDNDTSATGTSSSSSNNGSSGGSGYTVRTEVLYQVLPYFTGLEGSLPSSSTIWNVFASKNVELLELLFRLTIKHAQTGQEIVDATNKLKVCNEASFTKVEKSNGHTGALDDLLSYWCVKADRQSFNLEKFIAATLQENPKAATGVFQYIQNRLNKLRLRATLDGGVLSFESCAALLQALQQHIAMDKLRRVMHVLQQGFQAAQQAAKEGRTPPAMPSLGGAVTGGISPLSPSSQLPSGMNSMGSLHGSPGGNGDSSGGPTAFTIGVGSPGSPGSGHSPQSGMSMPLSPMAPSQGNPSFGSNNNNNNNTSNTSTGAPNTPVDEFEVFVKAGPSKDAAHAANSFFQQIYKGGMSMQDALKLMKNLYANEQNHFKSGVDGGSSTNSDRDIFHCMCLNIFDEYRFFSKYPQKELQISSLLYGNLISMALFKGRALAVALKQILEALASKSPATSSSQDSTPGDTNMFDFAVLAMQCFRSRLPSPEFTSFNSDVLSLPHFKRNQDIHDLYIDVKRAFQTPVVAMNGQGMSPVLSPMGINRSDSNGLRIVPSGNQSPMPSPLPLPAGMRDGGITIPNLGSLHLGGGGGGGGGNVDNIGNSPRPAPNPGLGPAGPGGSGVGGSYPSQQQRQEGNMLPVPMQRSASDGGLSLASAKGSSLVFGQSNFVSKYNSLIDKMGKVNIDTSNVIMSASSGTGKKEKGAKDTGSAGVLTDQEKDKIHFIFNNISLNTCEAKSLELAQMLTVKNIPWFGSYIIEKRVSGQPNFHGLYLAIITNIGSPKLDKAILKSTYYNITRLLQSPTITTSSTERSVLRNLGMWLGQMTLARNRPILQQNLNLKELLFWGYETGRLIAVCSFVAKIVEGIRDSSVFRPPNPWLMPLLGVLRDLYETDDLKMNIKFEVQVLCKSVNIRIEDIPRANILHTLTIPFKEGKNPDFNMNARGAPSGSSSSQGGSPILGGVSGNSPLGGVAGSQGLPSPQSLGGMSPLDSGGSMGAGEGIAFNTKFAQGVTVLPSASDAVGSDGSEERTVIPNLSQYVVVNPMLLSVGPVHTFRGLFCQALDKAIMETIHSAIDKTVENVSTTAKVLLVKDYVSEPSEKVFKKAAHSCVRGLVSSLVVVSCRETLRISIANHLRALLIPRMPNDDSVENIVKICTTDNVELGCALIEKAAQEKIISAIDEVLADSYLARQKHAQNDPQGNKAFTDPNSPSEGAEKIPASLRAYNQKQHVALYENFRVDLVAMPRPTSSPDDLKATGIAGMRIAGVDLSAGAGAGAGAGTLTTSQAVEAYAMVIDRLEYAIRQFLPATLSQLSSDNDVIMLMREIANITLQVESVVRVDTAVIMAETIMKRIFDMNNVTPSVLRLEALVGVLEILRDSSGGAQKVVPRIGSWISSRTDLSLDDDLYRKAHRTVLLLLLRSRLVLAQDIDTHFTVNMDGGRNLLWVETSLSIVRQCIVDGLASPHDFVNIFDAVSRMRPPNAAVRKQLQKWLHDLQTLVAAQAQRRQQGQAQHGQQSLPSPDGSSGIGKDDLNAVMNTQQSPRSLDSLGSSGGSSPMGLGQPGGTGSLINSPTPNFGSISNTSNKVDASVREHITVLLERWLRVWKSANEQVFGQYLQLMHQYGVLKAEESANKFFRLATELCVEACVKSARPTEGGATTLTYTVMDALSKLFLFLLRVADKEASNVVIRVNLLNRILTAIARVLMNDHEEKKANRSSFDQRPYLRLLSGLMKDLGQSEPHKREPNPSAVPLLTVYYQLFVVLTPATVPGFAFAWLQLISSKHFLPQLLQVKEEKGWPYMHRLLLSLFLFLQRFLKFAQMTDAIRKLYKGTLRVLLMVVHDFPEFLCYYQMSFCDVIPPTCIQLRNLILSAFPRSMRLPDPFTPNMKIESLQEILHLPRLTDNYSSVLGGTVRQRLDSFLNTRQPADFPQTLPQFLMIPAAQGQSGNAYNVPIMNCLATYLGEKGALAATSGTGTAAGAGASKEGAKWNHAHPSDAIFSTLSTVLDPEGRYYLYNAMANQLRYPSSLTYYFRKTILSLFLNAPNQYIQEQITRVLLERLIVHRPHPWGLLVTFIELIKNPIYSFWQLPFGTKFGPEIEKVFSSVARLCLGESGPNGGPPGPGTTSEKEGFTDMLSAYKTQPRSPASAPAPTPAPAPAPKAAAGVASSGSAVVSPDDDDDEEDDWENAADAIELKQPKKVEPKEVVVEDGPRKVYTKEEVMGMRPEKMPSRPHNFQSFQQGITLANNAKVAVHGYYNRSLPPQMTGGGGGGGGGRGGGGYQGGGGGGGGGDEWSKGQKMPQNYSGGGGGQGGQGGQGGGGRRGRQRQDPNAVYKSFLDTGDQEKKTETQVRSILNKLTPQNFPKLTAQLFEVQISSNAMLDKLINLVYDKAALEPNFANLYADMCRNLEEKSKYWSFLQCVYHADEDKYFWIKDLKYSDKLAGPYMSVDAALDAVCQDTPPETKEVTPMPQLHKIQLDGDMLSVILTNSDASVFYVTAVPFSDIAATDRSCDADGALKLFDDLEECTKNATKKNSFRRRLLAKCQVEFDKAIDEKPGSLRDISRQKTADLNAKRGTMDPEEFGYIESEIELELIKSKLRMMGCVKFIAELCKLELLQEKIMFACIELLLSNEDFTGFNAVHDEYKLDMLCKILSTVGYQLEENTKKRNQFLSIMQELTNVVNNKTDYSSRTRFSVEEVLVLRQNRWNARNQADGPATLEALKKKAAQEERMGMNKPGAKTSGGPGGLNQQGGRGGGRGGGGGQMGRGDARGGNFGKGGVQQQQQQQQQQQGQRPQLMARPGTQPQGSPSAKGGKGLQFQQMREQQQPGKGGQKGKDDRGAKDKGLTGAKGQGGRKDERDTIVMQPPSKPSKGTGRTFTPPLREATPEPEPDAEPLSQALDPEQLKKRSVSLVDEYMRVNDIDDVCLVCEELGAAFVGALISRILQKYVDIAKAGPQAQLIALLEHEDMAPLLGKAQPEVEDSLRASEYLQCLTDTIVDCKEAPEWLGRVVRCLMEADACRSSVLQDIVVEDKKINLDELCSLPEVTDEVYARFLVSATAEEE